MLSSRRARRGAAASATSLSLAAGLLLAVPRAADAAAPPTVSNGSLSASSVSLTRLSTTTVTVDFRLKTASGVSGPVDVVDRSKAPRIAATPASLKTGDDGDGTWQASLAVGAVMDGVHRLSVELCPVGRDCAASGPVRRELGLVLTVRGSQLPRIVRLHQEPRRLPAGATSGATAVGRVVFAGSRDPVKGLDVHLLRNGTDRVVDRTNAAGEFTSPWPWPNRSAARLALTQQLLPGVLFERTALSFPATRFRLGRPKAGSVTSVGKQYVVTGVVTPGAPVQRLGSVLLEEQRGKRWVRLDAARLRPVRNASGDPTQRASYRLTTRFGAVGGHALRVRKPAALCRRGSCRVAQGVSPHFGVVAGNRVYFVEQRLRSLGVPIGEVDGSVDARDRQAFCIWRDITRKASSRDGLTKPLIGSVMSRNKLPRADRPDGLYVNKTCQMLLQVVGGRYKRVVWASSGAPGYETPSGTGAIFRKLEGPVESTLYPGAFMYNPMFFFPDRPAIALHGSATNDLVLPYPASHGCIRVWRPQIHRIYHDSPIGTLVKVYGKY